MRLVFCLVLAVLPLTASAASPMQSLQQCIADNTTGADRKMFARWIQGLSTLPAVTAAGPVCCKARRAERA